MRIALSWLREFVAIDMPLPELAERIAVASAEVERITRRGVPDEGDNLGRFVVGRVLEAGKHPNADRLQLCRVDVGAAEPRQIVCGAWNFGAGATVCVAAPGAVLPDGRTLERAKLRGEVSEGMILAEDELDLGPDHSGIIVLPDGIAPGTPLADVLPVHDEVLEIELTANRSDLLSVYGVAREIAALYDLALAPMPGTGGQLPLPAEAETLEIDVADPAGCPRYLGRIFRGCRIGESPWWMKARLRCAGVRSISNVVDVTNYVMLELGSPLHAFDFERLAGGRIGVRRARAGEELVTLDGVARRLDPAELLITDALRAVAIAGIMGGLETEVGETTTDVLLEAASFEPVGILATSERLGLRSEASSRWEKGVDPQLAGPAAERATALLAELTGGRYAGAADVSVEAPARPATSLRPSRASAVVGVEITPAEQVAILGRLGFEVDEEAPAWRVTIPSWRARDVTREIDLVEEIARVHGLERVPFTLPARRAMFGLLTQEQRLRRLVEDVLVGAGLSEAYTWSLAAVDPELRALRLAEPLSAEHAILRTTLVEGLVGAAQHNLDAANDRIALFEVARAYLPAGAQLPDERWRVGGIVQGDDPFTGYERAKGAVEAIHDALQIQPLLERSPRPWLHPGAAAAVSTLVGGTSADAGWLGELHPTRLPGSWGIFELDLATLFAEVPDRVLYEDVITYPAVRQDLAFVVPEDVLAGELVRAAHDAAGQELREAAVFDVYRGGQVPEGRKSVALRVAFQSPERTLSDEDARVLRERIVAGLAARFGAELRA